MIVQAFVTLGLILSLISQVIIALELIRWPLKIVLKYEYLLSSIAFVCSALTGKLIINFCKKLTIFYFIFLILFLFSCIAILSCCNIWGTVLA